MGWQGFGQRKFPRVAISLPISILVGANKKTQGRIKNIGAGGLCVVSEESYPLFERVNIDFTLSGQQDPISCCATVVWSVATEDNQKKMFDLGMEFKALKKQDKDNIERYVSSLISLQQYSGQRSQDKGDKEDKRQEPSAV